MRKYAFKSLFWKLTVPAVALAPIAVVVACHKTGKVELIKVDAVAQNLSAIQVSGDTRNIVFSIPNELVYVNDTNELDETGTNRAFDVYARANIEVNGNALAINQTFMPADLLSYYLSGKLSYKGNSLVAASPEGEINVQQTFGGTFGFSAQNLAAINNNTQVGEWVTSLEAKYQPRGSYSLVDPKQQNEIIPIETTNLKTYVTLDTSVATTAPFNAKLAADPSSTNDSVTWQTPSIALTDLPTSWTTYVSGLRYSASNPATSATNISWQNARPTTFPALATNRYLLVQLTPADGYVLSLDFYDATQASNLRNLVLTIDSLPEYTAADLSKVVMRAVNGVLEIDESPVTLPVGAALEYQVGDATFYSKADFINEVKKLTSLTVSDIYVHLVSADLTKYRITNDKRTKPTTSSILGFVNSEPYFATLTNDLKVNLTTSTPSALVWTGLPAALPTEVAEGATRAEFLAGDYLTEAEAIAAKSWAATLPAAIGATWKDYNLWARLLPKANYLFNRTYADLSTTSQLKLVVPDTNIDALVQVANTLSYTNASTHDAVVWAAPLTIPTALVNAVASVEFASGNYANEAALSGATWSTDLPASVSYTSDERHLWMRVNPKSGFKFAKRIYDLTTSSKVQEILSKIDAASEYAAVDLTKIRIEGAITSPTIFDSEADSGVKLPVGSRLSYRIKNGAWTPRDNFVSLLITSASTLTVADFATIQVHLEPTVATKYVVVQDKIAKPNITKLTISSSSLSGPIISVLNAIKTASTSTHDLVVWESLPQTMPAGVQSFSYTSGSSYDTEDKVKASGVVWDNALSLPRFQTVDFDPNLRHVWVRVNPAAGYSFANPYYEITSSSNLRTVKGKIDALPTYAAVDFANVEITGSVTGPTINTSRVTLPTGSKITYSFKSSGWLEQSAFISYIISNSSSITAADFNQMQARLEPVDANANVVIANKQKAINTSKLTIPSSSLPGELVAALNNLQAQASSTHDAVVWTTLATLPTAVSAQIASLSYTSGNYASRDDMIAKASWTSSLPTTVSYTHADRNIWVRINPNAGYTFSDPYYNITSTSNIRAVKSKVDTQNATAYNAIDLTNITLTGVPGSIVVNASAITLPTGAKITYQFKGGTWTDDAGLRAAVNTAGLTATDLATVRARIEPVDTTYVVVNNRQAAPSVSGVTITVTSDIPQTLVNALRAIRPNSSSNNSAVTWASTTPTSLPSSVQDVKYLSGDYPDQTDAEIAPEAQWSTSLPATVSYTHSARNLWARVTPTSGNNFTSRYVNLTTDSTIRSILSLIDSNSNFDSIDLSRIILGGTSTAPTITSTSISTTAGVSTPLGAKLTYQIKGGSWLSGSDLQTYIVNNAVSLVPADISGVKARFESANTALYTITNNKEATVTTTLKLIVSPTAADIAQGGSLVAYENGFHNNVTTLYVLSWVDKPGSYVESVSYLYLGGAEYPDSDIVTPKNQPASSWVSTPPKVLDPEHKHRNLWIRFNPKPGYQFDQPYLNITQDSTIWIIAALIDALVPTELSNYDITSASITGTRDNPVMRIVQTTNLPRYTRIRYNVSLNGSLWIPFFSEADFLAYIKNLRASTVFSATVQLEADPNAFSGHEELRSKNYEVPVDVSGYTF